MRASQVSMQKMPVGSPGWEEPLEKELQYPYLGNLMDRDLVNYSPWGRKELDTI